MRVWVFAATVAALLAGCTPSPRDVTYFEAHPEETAKVVADCKTGAHRGEECLNARTADASIRRKARMEMYRKAF